MGVQKVGASIGASLELSERMIERERYIVRGAKRKTLRNLPEINPILKVDH